MPNVHKLSLKQLSFTHAISQLVFTCWCTFYFTKTAIKILFSLFKTLKSLWLKEWVDVIVHLRREFTYKSSTKISISTRDFLAIVLAVAYGKRFENWMSAFYSREKLFLSSTGKTIWSTRNTNRWRKNHESQLTYLDAATELMIIFTVVCFLFSC